MGYMRLWRRIRIGPGITLNLSKSGISTTVGVRGAHLTLGGRRGGRATIGIPGTGISYVEPLRASRGGTYKPPSHPGPIVSPDGKWSWDGREWKRLSR
jgi:hypothetical protein